MCCCRIVGRWSPDDVGAFEVGADFAAEELCVKGAVVVFVQTGDDDDGGPGIGVAGELHEPLAAGCWYADFYAAVLQVGAGVVDIVPEDAELAGEAAIGLLGEFAVAVVELQADDLPG